MKAAVRGDEMTSPTIGTDDWMTRNRNRFGVYHRGLEESGHFSPNVFQPWAVCQGCDHRANFDTHAEALAYANRMARKEAP